MAFLGNPLSPDRQQGVQKAFLQGAATEAQRKLQEQEDAAKVSAAIIKSQADEIAEARKSEEKHREGLIKAKDATAGELYKQRRLDLINTMERASKIALDVTGLYDPASRDKAKADIDVGKNALNTLDHDYQKYISTLYSPDVDVTKIPSFAFIGVGPDNSLPSPGPKVEMDRTIDAQTIAKNNEALLNPNGKGGVTLEQASDNNNDLLKGWNDVATGLDDFNVRPDKDEDKVKSAATVLNKYRGFFGGAKQGAYDIRYPDMSALVRQIEEVIPNYDSPVAAEEVGAYLSKRSGESARVLRDLVARRANQFVRLRPFIEKFESSYKPKGTNAFMGGQP